MCVLFVLSATSQAALIEVGFEASEGYNNGDETVGTSVTGGSFRYSGTQDETMPSAGYLVSDTHARSGSQSVAVTLDRNDSLRNHGNFQLVLDGDSVDAVKDSMVRIQHSIYKYPGDTHRFQAFKTGCCKCCGNPGGEMFQLGITGDAINMEAAVGEGSGGIQFQKQRITGLGDDEGWYDIDMVLDFRPGTPKSQRIPSLTVTHPGVGAIDVFATAGTPGGMMGFRTDHLDAENAVANRFSALGYRMNDPQGGDPRTAFDDISITIIPEPATCLLMAIGLVGLVSGLRRRTDPFQDLTLSE